MLAPRCGVSPVIVCPEVALLAPPGETGGVPPGGGCVALAPTCAAGLGGGPVGGSTCGDVPAADGWLCGVTLSFCPGSGSRPATASKKITTMATGIQIFMVFTGEGGRREARVLTRSLQQMRCHSAHVILMPRSTLRKDA